MAAIVCRERGHTLSIKGGPAYKFPWDALSMVPTLAPARRRRKISVEWGGHGYILCLELWSMSNHVSSNLVFSERLRHGRHDPNFFRMSSKRIVFAKGANFLYYMSV